MIAAIASVIVAIAAGITLFIQTVTLSSCRKLECCCGRCLLSNPTHACHTDAQGNVI